MDTALIETTIERCARYREENRFLGAEVDSHERIVLRAGESIDTIRMPPSLGERVRNELLGRDALTPTIENRQTGFLTFVTRPARKDDSPPMSKLFGIYAIPTVRGSLVTLPGPLDARRFWVEEPIGETRPDFATVVDIVLDAVPGLPKAG